MSSIINFYFSGGGWMHAILIAMVVAMAITVERFITLNFKNKIDPAAFINKLLELISRGNINSAIDLCNVSQAALPRIVRAGLEEFNKGQTQMQNAMELAAMKEIPKIEKRTQYLSLVANIATLLGLLGTIFGLIDSFAAVSSADASQKAALLASGIAVAMNTTAFGLIVAIPTLIFYSMLNERTTAITDEINENTARVFQFLTRAKGER